MGTAAWCSGSMEQKAVTEWLGVGLFGCQHPRENACFPGNAQFLGDRRVSAQKLSQKAATFAQACETAVPCKASRSKPQCSFSPLTQPPQSNNNHVLLWQSPPDTLHSAPVDLDDRNITFQVRPHLSSDMWFNRRGGSWAAEGKE